MKLKFIFLFLLLLLAVPVMATSTELFAEEVFDPLQLVSLLSPIIVWGAVELVRKLILISSVWILVLLVPLFSGISTYLLSLIIDDLNFIVTFALGFVSTFIDQIKKHLQASSHPT